MLFKNYKHLNKLLKYQHDKFVVLFSHHHLKKYDTQHQKNSDSPSSSSSSSSSSSLTKVLDVKSMMMLLLLLLSLRCVDAVGYSYTRFVGPVAGPEHKIFVNDASNTGDASRLDYVAKPEYKFSYGVEDADAHILHNRNEVRDGDVVKGVYSLIDPDGSLRVVKYKADETNGFQAEVIRNGISSIHGQLKNDYYDRAPPPEFTQNNNNNYYKSEHEQHHFPYFKGDNGQYNKQYPSSNIYTPLPNLEQLQPINHNHDYSYNPHNQYEQRPPQPPIIYHYNNNGNENNDDDDDDHDDAGVVEGVSDYHDEPQLAVYGKPNNSQDSENGTDDHREENDDNGPNSNIYYIKYNVDNKKHNPKEDNCDEDYSDDSDDEDDSEELEDYEEAIRNAQKSAEESDEYY